MQYINASFFEYIAHLIKIYNARRAEFSIKLVDGITYELRVPNEKSLLLKLANAKHGYVSIELLFKDGVISNLDSGIFDLVGTYSIFKHTEYVVYTSLAALRYAIGNTPHVQRGVLDKFKNGVYWVSAYDIIRAIYHCNLEEDQQMK
jgi:hypothetical protein